MDPTPLDDSSSGVVEGSWTPTLILLSLLVLRWIYLSQSNTAISLRRWLQMKKLQLKKQFGFRDESKYKMSVGDGANLKYKRQG